MLNMIVELHILCMKEMFEGGQLYRMCLAELLITVNYIYLGINHSFYQLSYCRQFIYDFLIFFL